MFFRMAFNQQQRQRERRSIWRCRWRQLVQQRQRQRALRKLRLGRQRKPRGVLAQGRRKPRRRELRKGLPEEEKKNDLFNSLVCALNYLRIWTFWTAAWYQTIPADHAPSVYIWKIFEYIKMNLGVTGQWHFKFRYALYVRNTYCGYTRNDFLLYSTRGYLSSQNTNIKQVVFFLFGKEFLQPAVGVGKGATQKQFAVIW